MKTRMELALRIFAAWCALGCVAGRAFAQDDQLTAKRRLFPSVGPGLRAVKLGADGNFYVLSAPGSVAEVFDAAGKLMKKVPSFDASGGPQNQQLHAISYGEDLDVDAAGTVYVADRGANAVKIWEVSGNARMVSVNAPISIACLPEEEFAVATLREPHLVTVFGKNGREVREFGDPEQISERAELNRYVSIGRLETDHQGHVYYGYPYMPEPLVREYDRNGYARQDIQYMAVEAMPAAQAARKEIERQERRGDLPSLKTILTGFGVDATSGEVWMALQNTLLHFDKEGNRRASYQIYTPEGARLVANTIVVEKDRLIIGSDPLGVYEFDRPDKKVQQ